MKNKLNYNPILKHEWLQYFGDQWISKEMEGIKTANVNLYVDSIEEDELEEALRSLKSKKMPGLMVNMARLKIH